MKTVAAPVSPYKGLAAFEDSDLDALLFFGRERESEVIAANLMASRLTVLFGPSGVGKSSVLRAGVAYRLRQEPGIEVVVHSTWTPDPTSAILEAVGVEAESLGDGLEIGASRVGGDLYLILDQFEEYFLYHERDRAFVEQLAEIVRRPGLRVNVLIGIREDSLAQLDAFKAVIPNLLSNRLRLERLDRTAGEAAIVGPVGRFNELVPAERRVEVEAKLVAAVLDDVATGRVEFGGAGRGVVEMGGNADRIETPYLQLVLTRLWEVETERGSRTLRVETLRELGGAAKIVEDHLEHAMADLSPREKEAAAAIYNFLVTPSGSKIAHRMADLAGYAEVDEDEAAGVLRRLTAERIVRASSENGAATRYEIYHDVLADAVLAWRNRYAAERALHDAERRRKRAFVVATAAVIALCLVGAIAVFALVERSHSRAEAKRAHARELAAEATSELETDPQKSVQLAVQAARLERGPHEEDVLRNALLAANQRAVLRANGPVRVALFDAHGRHVVTGSKDGKVRVYRFGSTSPERVLDQGGPVTTAAYSPNGRLLLTAGRDGTARIWGAGESPLHRLRAGGPVRRALFARRGQLVVTLAENGVVRVWRTKDGSLRRTIRVHGKARPKDGIVSPAGGLLVTVAQDRFARVYSLLTGLLVSRLEHKGFVHCASFSPNGSFFVTCGHEGVVRVWSTVTGQPVRTLRGPERAIVDGVFSPNGVLVAGAVIDGTARVWAAPTGLQIGLMFGHGNPVTTVAFSPTGTAIVTGSSDNRARTWLTNGKPVDILAGHDGPLNSVAFSPDGRSVVTASEDGTARLWESGTESDLALVARQRSITAFAVSPDGKRVIVGDARGVARVREVGRRRVVATARTRGPVTAVAFGPRGPVTATQPTVSLAVSGTRTARGRNDGSVLIQNSGSGREHVLRVGGGAVTAVAFSRDGELLAIGASDGAARVWDSRTDSMRSFRGHTLAVTSVAFSPDDTLLLSASQDHTARIWNVRTGRPEHVLGWHFGPLGSAAFSPDGRWVVTAGPSAAGVGLVSTGRRVLLLRGHTKPLAAAAFAGPSGQLIVTASKDGTIRKYRCDICGDVDELIALAKRRLATR